MNDKRFLISNEHEGVSTSLIVEGKKLQELIDKHLRSNTVYKLVEKKNEYADPKKWLQDISKIEHEIQLEIAKLGKIIQEDL